MPEMNLDPVLVAAHIIVAAQQIVSRRANPKLPSVLSFGKVIANGAGLAMSTLDVVAHAGEQFGGVKPANFLDIGGGASAAVMANGLDVILNDPQVKSVFVNVFGGITSCIEVANGIVGALETLGARATKPLVVRLDGNSVEEGRAILAAANHPLVTIEATMDGAAAKAAELAAAAA